MRRSTAIKVFPEPDPPVSSSLIQLILLATMHTCIKYRNGVSGLCSFEQLDLVSARVQGAAIVILLRNQASDGKIIVQLNRSIETVVLAGLA